MLLIPLQLYGIKPPQTHTHTQITTHAERAASRSQGPPLIMFLPRVPLSSLKLRQEKGVQTGAGRRRKAAETESSSLSGYECGSVCDGVCLWRRGCMGIDFGIKRPD